jgi:GNAT superfamily N-acetyltransferase
MADETAKDYDVRACAIGGLSANDCRRCVELVAAGGAVTVNEAKLRAATSFVLARSGNDIVGVGTIKRIRPQYAVDIADRNKSGYAFPPKTPELGYVAVDPEHRGKGLAHRIVAELLRDNPGSLFATTDHEAMKKTLATSGFEPRGREWLGRRNKMLSLWIKR